MNDSPTILLIDDDVELCESIAKLLSSHGYKTLIEHESNKIVSLLKNNTIDLILLDIMLPGGQDGIALCKAIRKLTPAPIIMLTGINADVERIISLEGGADNYITKPFSTRVLLAYISASLRRNDKKSAQLVEAEYEIYAFLEFKLNVTARILLSSKNEIVKLTSAEFILLQALLERPHCVISRDQLLDLINSNSDSFDRSIDILISRLRSKIEDKPRNPAIIVTMRNAGYSLACHVEKKRLNSKDWKNLVLNCEFS